MKNYKNRNMKLLPQNAKTQLKNMLIKKDKSLKKQVANSTLNMKSPIINKNKEKYKSHSA